MHELLIEPIAKSAISAIQAHISCGTLTAAGGAGVSGGTVSVMPGANWRLWWWASAFGGLAARVPESASVGLSGCVEPPVRCDSTVEHLM
jgi:hypothetical protein